MKTSFSPIYDHDSIHRAVAIELTPAYTKYMVDGAEVQCDRAKFEALPQKTRLLGVLEESYVLALERSLIPFDLLNDIEARKRAFDMALEKVCTSITSGWFREFAWENYFAVSAMYNQDYADKFIAALGRGDILNFRE